MSMRVSSNIVLLRLHCGGLGDQRCSLTRSAKLNGRVVAAIFPK